MLTDMEQRARVLAEDIEALRAIIGDLERVSTTRADLESQSGDESLQEKHAPEVVVWPESAIEVSEVLKFANQRQIPVTPRGGGSSREGNPIPVLGGIVLAMSRMDRILEIRPEDLQVRLQPGVIYENLKEQLGRHGLFFPPAPGSAEVATVGGMVANNSSGLLFVKYGATRDYVLKLEVVLPTGEIMSIGSNVGKTSSGYDLVNLFTGSEGTLGVITEITLSVRGLMEKTAGLAVFQSIKDAADAVFEMLRYGLRPAAMELMDAEIVRASNRWKGYSMQEAPTLVMEFHGTPAGVREEVEYAKQICEDHNCQHFEMGISAVERDRIWQGRKESNMAVRNLFPDHTVTVGDVVVPISKYPEAVEKAYEIGRKYGIRVATMGQAGDAHLHTVMFAKTGDEDSMRRAELVDEEIVCWAISVGGTASGSHGVGTNKPRYMLQEHGASLDVMKRIKDLLDPTGILNPGKIFEHSFEAEKYFETAKALTDKVRRSTRTQLDIPYGSHERQLLDIYLPEDADLRQLPVLMFMHGGGMVRGSKDLMGFMAPAITCTPAVFISVGYRLAPMSKYPDPVDDCRLALKWVHEHVADHGGNPERIFVGGHSSGGWLAALITLQTDRLDDLGLSPDVIKGCFSVSGMYDMSTIPPYMRARILSSHDDEEEASPLRNVSGNQVPFLLEVGEHDLPILRAQYLAMIDVLKSEPGHIEGMEREGHDHLQVSLDNGDPKSPWTIKVREWLAP